MKKLLFATMLLSGMSLFANNETKQPEKAKDAGGTVCCERKAKNSHGDAVTIRICVISTGDFAADRGRACAMANAAALEVANTLDLIAR